VALQLLGVRTPPFLAELSLHFLFHHIFRMSPAPHWDLDARRRRSAVRRAAAGSHRGATAVAAALECLRGALQDLPAEERRRSILELPPQLRAALLTFMQRQQAAILPSRTKLAAASQTSCKSRSQPADTNLQHSEPAARRTAALISPLQGVVHTRFQVHTQFLDLRIYTREFSTMEAAVRAQEIVTQLRDTLFNLEAHSPASWQDDAPAACAGVLTQWGTSDEALGLRAWVQLRAHRYLGPRHKISSPVGALCDIFQVHRRLLLARATSWEALRTEWEHLLRMEKGLSEKEATRHIDGVRREALRGRLAHALQRLRHALARRSGSARQHSQRRQTHDLLVRDCAGLYRKTPRLLSTVRQGLAIHAGLGLGDASP